MIVEDVSERFTYSSHYLEINGAKMHFIEEGKGDPVLFLHGIPTSCYIWRNIIPYLAPLGRCIAPDLMGFGRSDKPNIDYSITDHIRYIEAFIDALNLKNLILVMHGWGSIIGFDYAMRHESNCKGLAFYESFLRLQNSNNFIDSDISLPFYEHVTTLQEQSNLTDLTANGVNFINQILPQSIIRNLTEEEMNQYRRPFLSKGAGKPIAQYIKELPTGDGTSLVERIINRYSQKLVSSKLPKLMLYSIPGFIMTISTAIWAKEHLPHLEIVDIGEELHLAQESHPQLIGESISVWIQSIEQLHWLTES